MVHYATGTRFVFLFFVPKTSNQFVRLILLFVCSLCILFFFSSAVHTCPLSMFVSDKRLNYKNKIPEIINNKQMRYLQIYLNVFFFDFCLILICIRVFPTYFSTELALSTITHVRLIADRTSFSRNSAFNAKTSFYIAYIYNIDSITNQSILWCYE